MTNPPLPQDREQQVIMINSLLNIARGGLDRAAVAAHHAGLLKIEQQIREAFALALKLDRQEVRAQMTIKLNQGELFKDGPETNQR